MSKDLEKEYRALVNCEVPDLWARIEAGLDDKDSSGIVHETRKKNVLPIKVWATVAAACVCVGFIIPVMKAHMGGTKGIRNDTAAAPEYVAENADGYVAEEHLMADMNQASPRDESGSGAGNNVDSAAEDAVITADAAYDKGVMAENAVEEVPEIFSAKVEIVDVNVAADSGVLYKARVVESESPELQEDTAIMITASAPENEEERLEKGSIYDLRLQKDGAEALTYSIVK